MSKRIEHTAFILYLCAVFTFGFAGVGAGRILLFLSIAFYIAHLVEQRRMPYIPSSAWWALAYVAWTALALIWGPQGSAEPLYKHLPWLQIPLAAMLVTTPQRMFRVLRALAAGTGVLALRIFTETGSTIINARRDGLGIDYSEIFSRMVLHHNLDGSDIIARLVSQGGMQDGQRLVVGLIAVTAVIAMLSSREKTRKLMYLVLPASIAALFLTFKRGAWLALFAVILIEILRQINLAGWLRSFSAKQHRIIPGLLIIAILLLTYTLNTTGHISQWRQKTFETLSVAIEKGGRTCMWLEITPAILRQYPLGIGFKALTNEQMRAISPQVEEKQNHVHSNIMQALIDGGWPGLILFSGWMLSAFVSIYRYSGISVCNVFNNDKEQAAADQKDKIMAWTLGLMLTALFIMGLFEYQIGSGQIVLLYGMIMGCAAAGKKRANASGSDL